MVGLEHGLREGQDFAGDLDALHLDRVRDPVEVGQRGRDLDQRGVVQGPDPIEARVPEQQDAGGVEARDAVREHAHSHLGHEGQRPAVHAHEPGGLGVFLRAAALARIHAPEQETGPGRRADQEGVRPEGAFGGGGVGVGHDDVAALARVAGSGQGQVSGPFRAGRGRAGDGGVGLGGERAEDGLLRGRGAAAEPGELAAGV